MRIEDDDLLAYSIYAVFIVSSVLLIGSMMLIFTTYDAEYNREVHCYIENARYTDDAISIVENLTLAIDGMNELGLEPNMHGVYFSWERNPGNSMATQYAQLQTQINRAIELSNMSVYDYNYEDKLRKIHNYLYDENGWADEVAYTSYSANFHPMVYFWIPILSLALSITFGCASLFIFLCRH